MLNLQKKYNGIEARKWFETFYNNVVSHKYKSAIVPTLDEMLEIIELCTSKRAKEEIKFKLISECYNLFDEPKQQIIYNIFIEIKWLIFDNLYAMKGFIINNKLSDQQKKSLIITFIDENVNPYLFLKLISVFEKIKVKEAMEDLIDVYLGKNKDMNVINLIALLCESTMEDIISSKELYHKYYYAISDEFRGKFLENFSLDILDKKDIIIFQKFKIKEKITGYYAIEQIMATYNIPSSIMIESVLEVISGNQITISEELADQLNSFDVMKKLVG